MYYTTLNKVPWEYSREGHQLQLGEITICSTKMRRDLPGKEGEKECPKQRKQLKWKYQDMKLYVVPKTPRESPFGRSLVLGRGQTLEGQSLRNDKLVQVRCGKAQNDNMWSLEAYPRQREASSNFKTRQPRGQLYFFERRLFGLEWREAGKTD